MRADVQSNVELWGGVEHRGPWGGPRRVAIVSDGSARWAQAHGYSLRRGHEASTDTVIARILDAIELGIEELVLYAFSTENWGRPPAEVRELLGMLARRIVSDAPALHARGVRISFIGRRDRGGELLIGAMESAERLTRENGGMRVFVALDYGGRD